MKKIFGDAKIGYQNSRMESRKKGGMGMRKSRPVVNFINVKCTNFSYKRMFPQLFLRTCN